MNSSPGFIRQPPVLARVHSKHFLAALVASSALCWSGLGQTADAPPFPELLRASVARAPLLLAEAATVRAAGADAEQARAWINPRIDALVENLNAPQTDGTSQRQNTYSITQPFEVGGKRGARIELGRRNLVAAEARERQTQVEYAGQLATAYALAEAMQARRVIASQNLERAGDELKAARALVDAGREPRLRVLQAQASVATALAEREGVDADTATALARLAALAGSRESYTGVAASILSTKIPEPPVAGSFDAAPTVAAARAERDALDAQVDVENKRSIPDVNVTAGVRRYGFTNASGYVVGVGVSIPLFDRNRYGVVAATERAAAADARLDAARLEVSAARTAAMAQTAASARRLGAAAESERAASEAYRLGRIGYDVGKTPLIDLLTARRSLAQAQELVIDARLARVRALAALAQADGRLAFEDAK